MIGREGFTFFQKRIVQIFLIALIYYLSARLGLLLAYGHTNASPVWPPSGFAFAAILILGPRIWPGILIGAFSANIMVFLANHPGSLGSIYTASGFIALGNTLEVISGYYILKVLRSGEILSRAKDFFQFIIATLVMCMFGSTIGSSSLYLNDIISKEIYTKVWFTWWTGDVTGILVLTPIIIAWVKIPMTKWKLSQIIEFLFLFFLLGFYTYEVLGNQISLGLTKAHVYLLFIFFIWTAFRMDQRQSSLIVLLISALSIWQILNGKGPFIENSQNESLLSLQIFIGVASIIMMFFSTTLRERRMIEEQLKLTNNTLEDRVAERTEVLEKQKEELQNLLHVVSHDLQEPLRTISGFLQLLVLRVKEKLSEKELEYINFAVNGAQRMKTMILDLLLYSKLGISDELEIVDLNTIIEEVKLNLKQSIDETNAEIIIQKELPILNNVSRTDMILLFQNLISNAIKYRSEQKPIIRVSSEHKKKEWLFCVKDNGVGIEEKYSKKIFEIFQRLHGTDKYSGTGMGLALCKKIVKKYEGRIWAESANTTGSRFFFTIKANNAKVESF